jgi:hypothetical protein
MVTSGMLSGVALVRTDVSDELSASFIMVTKIGELGTTLAVTSNLLVTASVVPSSPILVTLSSLLQDKIIVPFRQLPPLSSSGQSIWLLTERSRVRFLALPDFLSSSESGTGSTQPL